MVNSVQMKMNVDNEMRNQLFVMKANINFLSKKNMIFMTDWSTRQVTRYTPYTFYKNIIIYVLVLARPTHLYSETSRVYTSDMFVQVLNLIN